MGLAPYAISPRKDRSEIEEISVQKVGIREDKEKKTYEPYTSRERRYEQRDQREVVGVGTVHTINVPKSTQL
jgi:hypothetical protein